MGILPRRRGHLLSSLLVLAVLGLTAPAGLAAAPPPDTDTYVLAHLRAAGTAGGAALLVGTTIELGKGSPSEITLPLFVFDMGKGRRVTVKQLSVAGPDGRTRATARPNQRLRPISDLAGTKAAVLARLADRHESRARRFLDRSAGTVITVPVGDLRLSDGSTTTFTATALLDVGGREVTATLPLQVTVASLPSETYWGAGDGHVHSSTWSVGSFTIAQRAAQAVNDGQKWLIMTDHWDWIQERASDDLADWQLYAADCATQQAAYGIPVFPGLEIAALLNKSHNLAYGLDTSVLPPADEAYPCAELVDRINSQNPGTSFAVAAHPYLSSYPYEDFTADFRAIELISSSATSNSSAVKKWFELLNAAVDRKIAGGSFPVGVGNSDAHTAYSGVNGMSWIRSPQGFSPSSVLETLKSGAVTASGRGDLGYFTLNGVEQGGVLPVYPTTTLKLSISQLPRTGRVCTRISIRNRNNAEIWYVANPTQTTYTPTVPQPTYDTFRVVMMTFAKADGTDVSHVWCNPVFLDMNPAANRAPLAAADAYATAQDTPLSVAAPGVLANDADPDGDALSATLAVAPAHGTVALGPLGGFLYTPAAGYAGPDAFTYTVSDGRGGSATATVTLTVSAAKTRFEQTDPRIIWAGAWSSSKNSRYSGGSAYYSRTAGAKVTVSFAGTAIDLVGAIVPAGGSARISVDGGAAQTVRLAGATTLYQQIVFSRTGLAQGRHTLIVEAVGDGKVFIDAVDIAGTL